MSNILLYFTLLYDDRVKQKAIMPVGPALVELMSSSLASVSVRYLVPDVCPVGIKISLEFVDSWRTDNFSW